MSHPRPYRASCVIVGLLAAVLAGCQTSPEQRLAVANDAFASTLDVLSDAREAGKVSDATQTEVVAPARKLVDALLDVAYAAVERGDSVRLREVLAEIDKALTPLLRARFAVERKGT